MYRKPHTNKRPATLLSARFYKYHREENRSVMLGLGTMELVVVLFIILLLFGGKKLPELARSMGSAVREYTKASTGDAEEEKTPKKKEDERTAILEAAKKLGIETEGKSIKEIAQELVEAAEKK